MCLGCVGVFFIEQCDRLVDYSRDVQYDRQQLVPALGLQQPHPDLQLQHPEDQPEQ